MRWKINEIFYSLQGEGFNTGTPAVFVRFSGCNLRCAFCDTDHQNGEPLTTEQIIERIRQYPCAQMIVLTGGEPSLFIDEAFVAALKTATNLPVAIETNGTHPLPANLDWITLSPKNTLPGATDAPLVVTACDELKVVFLGQDLSQYDGIEAKHRFLQPCFSEDPSERSRNLEACVNAVMSHRGWRLSLQTHRLLSIK